MIQKLSASLLLLLLSTIYVNAQDSTHKHLPIIDVHVHAMKVNPAFAARHVSLVFKRYARCRSQSIKSTCLCQYRLCPATESSKSDKEFQDSLIATMKRLNMTIIASGDASVIRNWQKAAEPGRVIPSIGISSSKDMTVVAFTDSLSSGFYKVMGEVAPQYQGMSPSDTSLDAYFAAAEKLNIPVGIHMGTGGNGIDQHHRSKIPCFHGQPIIAGRLIGPPSKIKSVGNACRLSDD